jgi:hypothetical protein
MSLEPVRLSFRRYVRIVGQVVREHDFRQVGDLILDLSTRGMLVRASTRVLTGEEVIASFNFHTGSRPACGGTSGRPPKSNEWFDVQGVVARVVHGRRPGDYGLSFGVEFVGMKREDELRLFENLRGLAAPDAQRPPRPLHMHRAA